MENSEINVYHLILHKPWRQRILNLQSSVEIQKLYNITLKAVHSSLMRSNRLTALTAATTSDSTSRLFIVKPAPQQFTTVT